MAFVEKYRNFLIIGAAVLIAIAVVILYIYTALSAIKVPLAPTNLGAISANISVVTSGILTYNESQYLASYAKLSYTARNATFANISIASYKQNPLEGIYFINTGNYCVNCLVESAVYSSLESNLGPDVLINSSSINNIGVAQVGSIPPNSIVVITSGLMPDILLPGTNSTNICPKYSNVTILTMLGRGDTVIYVGRNFSTVVTCNQQLAQTPLNTLAILANASITTIQVPAGVLFNTTNNLAFSAPTFGFLNGSWYGRVASVKSLNGTLIALSNYPQTGWNYSPSALGRDIASIIESRYWMTKLMYGYDDIPLQAASNGTATVFTDQLIMRNVQNSAQIVNSSYGLVDVKLSNSNHTYSESIPLSLRYQKRGMLSTPPIIGEAQQMKTSVEVNNINGVGSFHINVYNLSLSEPLQEIFVGSLSSSAVVYEYPSFQMPSGFYIADLVDSQNNTYAQSIFYITNVSLTLNKADFRNKSFSFYATSNGAVLSGVPYRADIGGAYPETGTIVNGFINYTLPKGSVISYGNKTFDLYLFGDTYTVKAPYQSKGLVIPPIYIEFAVAAVFIIVLDRILRVPIVDEYYIDLPDFPASKKMKVKESPEAILNVFESVNHYYNWKRTPLSPEEVKSGVSNNIRYENMPIAITLQNTLALLNRMARDGLLEECNGYYAPKKWIQESGHDMEYLVIFRRLRDYCIANAILFSEIDSSTFADMVITNKGVQSYILIASGEKIKEIEMDADSRIFIVFLNEDKKAAFVDKLHNSYGTESELLKMAIEYQTVRPIDVDGLSQLSL